MLAHVSIGVCDVDTSRAFYDDALAPLGYRCIRAARSMVGYGYAATEPLYTALNSDQKKAADEIILAQWE